MSKIKTYWIRLTKVKARWVEADFDGGEVSSDGGLLLLREVDRRLSLTRRAVAVLEDRKQSGKVAHDVTAMLRQRVYAMCAGWEDLNDAQALRKDRIHQIAADSDDSLASASPLCPV